jgi:hypothetical protein
MILLLILSAPVLQIIFSALRIHGKINLPIGAIAFLSVFVAFFVSLEAGKIVLDELDTENPGRAHCGMPALGCFVGGMMIDIILIIIITLICYAVYRARKKEITTAI